MSTGVLFGRYSSCGTKLTACLHLLLRLKMSEATSLLPCICLHSVHRGNPTSLEVFRQSKQTCRIYRGGTLLKECFFICNRIKGQHDCKLKRTRKWRSLFQYIYILSEHPPGRNRKVNAICHEPATDVL
jgi:hypothetical protein